MYLSEIENPVVGLEVISVRDTPGRIIEVVMLEEKDLTIWKVDAVEPLVKIQWENERFSTFPLSNFDRVRVS